jgi:hypothetical protein
VTRPADVCRQSLSMDAGIDLVTERDWTRAREGARIRQPAGREPPLPEPRCEDFLTDDRGTGHVSYV